MYTACASDGPCITARHRFDPTGDPFDVDPECLVCGHTWDQARAHRSHIPWWKVWERSVITVVAALAVAAGLALFPIQPTPAAAAAGSTVCQFRGAARPAPVRSTPAQFSTAKTWVYGDSITWQSYPGLGAQLRHSFAVDAYWGRDTRSAVEALAQDLRRNPKRKHRPKVVVMAVGTNDLHQLAGFRQQVARTRHMLPKRIKLVWVNTYRAGAPRFNDANRIIRSTPGVRVVSWSALLVRSQAGRAASPLLQSDGTHLTRQGCAERNKAIAQVVNRIRGQR